MLDSDMEFIRVFPPATVAGPYAFLLSLCELIVLGEAAQDRGDTVIALTSPQFLLMSLWCVHSQLLYVFKLDVDGQIDSFHLFLSPRQVHLLLDMLAAIAGPGKYPLLGYTCNSWNSKGNYRTQMSMCYFGVCDIKGIVSRYPDYFIRLHLLYCVVVWICI